MVLTDINGRILVQESLSEMNGTEKINTSKWTPGIYFISIYNHNGLAKVDKIIKR